jgi:hypothetical protein
MGNHVEAGGESAPDSLPPFYRILGLLALEPMSGERGRRIYERCPAASGEVS